MSQSKSKGVKVHSKSSSEKLSSDSQGSKHKARTLNSKRQFSSTKPARKASPQGNHTYGSVTNGEGVVEDLKSKAEIEKINLKTLQNIDGEIAKILSVIPWVELYQYKDSENMWVSLQGLGGRRGEWVGGGIGRRRVDGAVLVRLGWVIQL